MTPSNVAGSAAVRSHCRGSSLLPWEASSLPYRSDGQQFTKARRFRRRGETTVLPGIGGRKPHPDEVSAGRQQPRLQDKGNFCVPKKLRNQTPRAVLHCTANRATSRAFFRFNFSLICARCVSTVLGLRCSA